MAQHPGRVRSIMAAVVLVVVVILAVLGVYVHYSFLAVYGTITDTALQGLAWGFTAGVSSLALIVVVLAAVLALVVSPRWWMRLTAVALPVLMVLGMLVVTPLALRQKAEGDYEAGPHCMTEGFEGAGLQEVEAYQAVFDSIEHVGHFGGDGSTGAGGCDQRLVAQDDVDVLGHYRAALPAAGWRVVTDDGGRLRGERDGMAFEVVACPGGGIVWAGRADGVFDAPPCAH